MRLVDDSNPMSICHDKQLIGCESLAEPLVEESGDKMKKDDGKPRFDLIPAEAMFALAELYGTGARKYYDRCWEEGMSWGRLFRAMMSHGWKWWRGETHDDIDGQHHLIAVAWCAFALYCYEVRGIGEDNRP